MLYSAEKKRSKLNPNKDRQQTKTPSPLLSPPAFFIFFFTSASAMASSSSTEAMDTDSSSPLICVERNPPESRLAELGIKSWPKWGCPPGKFPLKYDAKQTCYLLKGKVKAYIKGSSEYVEFGAGDLVTIPKGLSCTWDVSVSVDKHYKFYSP